MGICGNNFKIYLEMRVCLSHTEYEEKNNPAVGEILLPRDKRNMVTYFWYCFMFVLYNIYIYILYIILLILQDGDARTLS